MMDSIVMKDDCIQVGQEVHWLQSIYLKSLQHVSGYRCVQAALLEHPILSIPRSQIWILAIGKAALSMAEGALDCLGEVSGLGITKELPKLDSKRWRHWDWMCGDHPVPGTRSHHAGQKIQSFCTQLPHNATILVLLSGGASALVVAPLPGLTLEDIAKTTNTLLHSGADIHSINCVRKQLSSIKGGLLLKCLQPRTIWTLALSDVEDNDPESIGSGLTVPNSTSVQDALDVLYKYTQTDSLSHVIHFLERRLHTQNTALAPVDWDPTSFSVVGHSKIWLDWIENAAQKQGLQVCREARFIAEPVEKFAIRIRHTLSNAPMLGQGKIRLFLWGGEPTVSVKGAGKGGRMQHIALLLSPYIAEHTQLYLLAAGSDGSDGNTDCAGALIGPDILSKGICLQDFYEYLSSYDSYAFHQCSDSFLQTGVTGTNVCDIVMILQFG